MRKLKIVTMDNKNLPAYPTICYETSDNGNPGCFTKDSGFTKRELGAFIIASGMIGNYTPNQDEYVIERATKMADTLLTHLENTQK
jgi:hypothetical protein